MTIRVLIVDDSALVRQLLTEILSRDPELKVVGTAQDPYEARARIKELLPDVLTLDVEMPRMDGLTFLENLMRLRPMPVLMVSSLTEASADVTLQALELGAVDYVTKPRLDIARGLNAYADALVAKLKAVAASRPHPMPAAAAAQGMPAKAARPAFRTTDRIIAIGASTGGTEAVREVLQTLPADSPAVVVAQHIPAAFSQPFAQRLDRHSAMSVAEARDGQPIVTGCVYIAPGDRHLCVQRDGAHFRCRISEDEPVNHHRPSVDVLFRSVARAAGANAVGAILTGMGDDGAQGLLEMRLAGAPTFAQDEASSVVWGMPGSAVRLGAVDQVVPLARIAEELLRHARASHARALQA